MHDKKNQTYLFLIFATVAWGIQPLFIKIIVREWSPVTLTCIRYFFVSSILFFIMWYRKDKQFIPPTESWLALLIMGITGVTINNVSQFTGLKYSTITNCTLIAATAPVVTAFISALFLRERLNALQWIGIVISFFGAIYLVSRGSLETILQLSLNYGDLLFFFCQLNWAIYSIVGVRVMQKYSAVATTAWAGLIGAITAALYGLIQGELQFIEISQGAVLSFAYVVFFGGVLSMLFWNLGVRNAGPTIAAIFSNLTPIAGMLCGFVFLNETIGFEELIGAGTILGGVYLTTHSEQFLRKIKKETAV